MENGRRSDELSIIAFRRNIPFDCSRCALPARLFHHFYARLVRLSVVCGGLVMGSEPESGLGLGFADDERAERGAIRFAPNGK